MTLSPPVKVRTQKQQERIRKKFLQLKEKKKARALSASQQHQLAEQPAPPSDPETTCSGSSNPIQEKRMELDKPASKSLKLEELASFTSREQHYQNAISRKTAEEIWLVSVGLSLEKLPETMLDIS